MHFLSLAFELPEELLDLGVSMSVFVQTGSGCSASLRGLLQRMGASFEMAYWAFVLMAEPSV